MIGEIEPDTNTSSEVVINPGEEVKINLIYDKNSNDTLLEKGSYTSRITFYTGFDINGIYPSRGFSFIVK